MKINKITSFFIILVLSINSLLAQTPGSHCSTTVTIMYGPSTISGEYDCNGNCVLDWGFMFGFPGSENYDIHDNGECNDGSNGGWNYNCSAFNYDGGECVNGCTNPSYLEYHTQGFSANVDDGSCNIIKVDGCTNSNFIGYNSNATYHVQSYCGEVKKYGCTNSNFYEYYYDEDGNFLESHQLPYYNVPVDDCENELKVGCLDENACNYNDYNNDGVADLYQDNPSVDINFEDNTKCKYGPDGVNNFDVRHDNSIAGEGRVVIEWDDASTNNTIYQFRIMRKRNDEPWQQIGPLLNNSFNESQIQTYDVINQKKQAYYDSDIANCNTYKYKVVTISCDNDYSVPVESAPKEVVINTQLNNTWDTEADKILTATKGDYENRVELSWSNNNNIAITNFEIFRKELTSNSSNQSEYVKIGETSNEVHHFVDYNISSNVIYNYQVNAVIPSCDDSNSSEDVNSSNFSNSEVGFRLPYSSIYGQITYDGYGSVPNAEVFAEIQSDLLNKSLKLDEFSFGGNYLFDINCSDNDITGDLSFMFWFKINKNQEMSVFNGFNGGLANEVLISENKKIKFNGIEYGSELSYDWHQLTCTYNHQNQELKLFLNGENIGIISSNLDLSANAQFFKNYSGLVDEISLWNKTLDENFISQHYNKFLLRQQEGMIAYYHCDEGVGNSIYDASISNETSLYNYNHIHLASNYDNFDSDAPTSNELNYSTLTDSSGFYGIEEIRFGSTGSNFTIIPVKNATLFEPAHEFEPSYLNAYIADNVDYLSNYNFTDVSSFNLSGNVFYLDPNKTVDEVCFDSDDQSFDINGDEYLAECETKIDKHDGTFINEIGVKNVEILVDGQPVYDENGNQELTDINGYFNIKVPIGLHEISVKLDGHTFVKNIWDSENHISVVNNDDPLDYSESRMYPFIQNEQDITFYDNTKRKLVGRVCGGLTEASKPFDGSSINNIGQANFVLHHNNLHSVLIVTDENTGEYNVDLLPLSYDVLSRVNGKIILPFNPNATFFFSGVDIPYPYYAIDLSEKGDTINDYDNYRNFIYRKFPEVFTYTHTNSNSHKYIGEQHWNILNQEFDPVNEVWIDGQDISIPLVLDNGDYVLTSPVLKKDYEYTFLTSVQEVYEKIMPNGEVESYTDTIKSGTLSISDGSYSKSYEMDSDMTEVKFTPNQVNTSLNGSDSFKKQFTITYTSGSLSKDKIIDYFSFGSRVDEGLNFFSSGPEVVEMVLRDPPGDQSYSYIESGSSYQNSVEVYSAGDVISDHIEKDINLGTKLQFSIPFGGPIITTEIIANTQVDLTFESIIDTTETITYESSNSQSYQTSTQDYNIGSGGDLYIANNYNMVYGTNKFLEIIDVSDCGNQGIVCFGETSPNPSDDGSSEGAHVFYSNNNVDYTIGTSVGLEIVPVGFQTKTVYDQNHILKKLIPTLEWIRNTYFGMDQVYVRNDFTDYDPSTPKIDYCYDNLTHELYDESTGNIYPCYEYVGTYDTSDPYILPFNLFDDINIADYIPDDFVYLVEEILYDSYQNGNFSGLSASTISSMQAIANTADNVGGAINAVDQVMSSSFWSDFAGIIGGQNLLLGIETFKSEVLDFYADELSNVDEGISSLISVLNSLNHSVPNDKVEFYNQQINLWKNAVYQNESDKASIFDNVVSSNYFSPELLSSSTFGPDQNYSFSGGNTIAENYRVTNTESILTTIDYSIDGSVAYEIGGKIQGFGQSYQDKIPITFKTEKRTNNTNSDYLGFGYVLSDDDESDYFSVDVKKSNNGWGPIFRKRAGQSMCPHEGQETFLFYSDNSIDDNIFSPATQPREFPNIEALPSTITGVPESEPAIFNIQLTNNSASMEDIVYTLMVDELSNPFGAILLMDGQPVQREILVPYNQTINKTLTVYKGPEHLDYTDQSSLEGEDNSIGLILRSSCQYSYGTSNVSDIADTVYIQVSYVPECTNVQIYQPSDSWVLNKSTEDTLGSNTTNYLSLNVGGFDHNYYSLENITLQYKNSLESDANYTVISSSIDDKPAIFKRNLNQTDDYFELPSDYILLDWDMHELPDGNYDIRAFSDCGGTISYSNVHSGYKDTRIPEPYGNPQPSDGILSTSDEITLNWTEQIDQNRFYSQETIIQMSAVKNQSNISHDAYVYVDSNSVMNIPYGLNLNKKSFTVEMWVQPSSYGTLFTQGHENNQIKFGIQSDGKLFAQYEISGDLISAISATSLDSISVYGEPWNHLAFVFDNDQKTISFIINGELITSSDASPFLVDYIGEGSINIGNDNFSGGIHELRVWSTNKNTLNIYQNMNKSLIGNEAGLQGYWPLNELHGNPKDLAKNRNISGDINWSVHKKGFGYDFNSNTVLNTTLNSSNLESTDNFTLEFWFKTSSSDQTIFTTGSIDEVSLLGNYDAWSIAFDDLGKLIVKHNINNNSNILLESQFNYNDNLWHHFALTKNSKANTSLIIDGHEIASCSSEQTRGFSISNLILGAELSQIDSLSNYHNYFNGMIDDFRFWSINRSISQINRFKNLRLNGSELGLKLYYPFEEYQIFSGNNQLVQSLNNQVFENNLQLLDETDILSFESTDLPIIRMSNPYVSVSHSAFANNDQTLLTINDNLSSVEGTIIDVSIDNIYDLYGNKAKPVSWSFFVDKNQLVWADETISIEKHLGSYETIETSIINHGGTVENFTIENIPNWLSVSPSNGIINPNSSISVSMDIDPILFIGDYSNNIILTGNNGVGEKLDLNVNVEAIQPNIEVFSEDFQYDMSFIGKVSVDNVRSRDDLDILIAYVNDEPRGYASPTYIEDYDAFFVFLTVYSNSQFGEEISFRLWDASEGKIQSNVTLNLSESVDFYDGSIQGSMQSLSSFNANNSLRQEIILAEGWNWFSLNLIPEGSNSYNVPIPIITNNLNDNSIEILKGQNSFAQYSENYGWLGSLQSMKLGDMYMIKIDQSDTISYDGRVIDYNNSQGHIDIDAGWNWIGYLGQRPLEINQALSSLNPASGDLIKNKSSFSVFASESIGWIGTLQNISEGEGYMLNSSDSQVLIYPENSLYGSSYRVGQSSSNDTYWKSDNYKFESSMSVIASIDDSRLSSSKENCLAAFSRDECRGSSTTFIDNFSNNNLIFLTVHGINSDSIYFKYFDEKSNIIYRSNEKIEFSDNTILGSIDDPFKISFYQNNLSENFEVYPNPFKNSLELEFYSTKTEIYKIEIYDLMGRQIKTLFNGSCTQGNQYLDFDMSELKKGYYIIQLENETNVYKKPIIKS
tara:strand:- start:1206 stop:10910 length:9705 start_codon:yes stop_codon:yes gene_type:complete